MVRGRPGTSIGAGGDDLARRAPRLLPHPEVRRTAHRVRHDVRDASPLACREDTGLPTLGFQAAGVVQRQARVVADIGAGPSKRAASSWKRLPHSPVRIDLRQRRTRDKSCEEERRADPTAVPAVLHHNLREHQVAERQELGPFTKGWSPPKRLSARRSNAARSLTKPRNHEKHTPGLGLSCFVAARWPGQLIRISALACQPRVVRMSIGRRTGPPPVRSIRYRTVTWAEGQQSGSSLL